MNAHIRHHHTDYEDSLSEVQHGMSSEEYEAHIEQGTLPAGEEKPEANWPLSEVDKGSYHGLKADAFTHIQEFLEKHRHPAGNS